jgi:hypothetical protein
MNILLKKSFFSDFFSQHPVLVIVVVAILLIIGVISNFLGGKKEVQKKASDIIEPKWINEEGLSLYNQLRLKYSNNESLSINSIPELYDLEVKSLESVNAKFNVIEGKTSLRLWACIEWLNNRFLAENMPLKTISEEEAQVEYSINLVDGEILHTVFEDAIWYELKRSRSRSFNYHGLGLRIPIGGGFSYKIGAISSLNPTSRDEYSPISSGRVFLTNRRVILQGNEENKSVNINSILDIEQYLDCVIIGKSKGKKPLIKFELDDAAVFSRLITRVF